MLTGQIIGIAAIAVSSVIYLQRTRKKMIACKLITDLLWVIHHLCIFSYTAAATTAIAIGREFIFMQESKKWSKSPVWIWVFSILFFVSAFFTWKDIFSIFPPVASSLATIGFFCKNVKMIRIFSLLSSFGMMAYGIHYLSIPTIINEVIVEVSIITMLIKSQKESVLKSRHLIEFKISQIKNSYNKR